MFKSTEYPSKGRSLSPRDLATAVGAGRSTVQRWVDGGVIKASRTVGGHRRIELSEAVRFIRSRGLRVQQPSALGLDLDFEGTDSTTAAVGNGSLADRFAAAVDAGKTSICGGLLTSALLDGASIERLCDEVIATAMRRYGDEPTTAPDTIVREHRANEICLRCLHDLRRLLPDPGADAPVAVGGASPGDVSTLPTAMVAATLAANGWQTTSLGPNTPVEAIAAAAVSQGASLAWLSMSRNDLRDPAEFTRLVVPLVAAADASDVRLVVGGRGIPTTWRPSWPHVSLMYSMRELAAYAMGSMAVHRS